ncbi:MAG: TetR/AcrR family transcriptional regulator [Elusimicrobiota bacterium]|nr:TetR/AcrR family transcriptional regulator [Elusimicrobiota bacterium]
MNKKEKILKSARKIFAHTGYHEAGIDEIADLAGVGKGTVYLYFKNKEELFTSVIFKMLERTGSWVDEIREMDVGVWEKVEAMITTALDYFSRNREVFNILQGETPLQTVAPGGEMAGKIKDIVKERMEKLAGFFAEHRREANLSDEFTDREAAFLCLNVVEGIVRRFLEGWEKDTRKNAKLAVKFLKNGLTKH